MKLSSNKIDNILKNRQYFRQSRIIIFMFPTFPYECSLATNLVDERFTPDSETVSKNEKIDIMIDQLPKSLLDILLDRNILKIIEIVFNIIDDIVRIIPFFINTFNTFILFSIIIFVNYIKE